MHKTFFCFGTKQKDGMPGYFFLILPVTDKEMKDRPLTGAEIMRLAEGRVQNLISATENESLSALVEKLLPMVSHQYGKDQAIDLLQDFMGYIAESISNPTFDPAAFIKQRKSNVMFQRIRTAFDAYNAGSSLVLIASLADGAFQLSRHEILPIFDSHKNPDVQTSDSSAIEARAAA